MRRFRVVGVALSLVVVGFVSDASAANPKIAAAQIALRAHGHDPGPVDGVAGPLTRNALASFQRAKGLKPDGKLDRRTRRAFGKRGRPLLGQRELAVGDVGWDVAVLEFRLRKHGLGPRAIDGRFTRTTGAVLRRFQQKHALVADGIAGPMTYRVLARNGPVLVHRVVAGESFFSIAALYRVSPWQLARKNGIPLTRVIVPGQRLVLPAGASRLRTPLMASVPATRQAVRAAVDKWARHYGVDPKLARALAWMESGFQQDVVSNVGAIGVMQLLPETWEFVDTVLLGFRTPRTYEGNVRAGVRYLRWQLDQFDGDVRLALSGWYQGARAVRERGIFLDTKQFVSVVLALYGTV